MKYIDADRLRAEIDKRYAEYRAKMKTDDFTYYEGMADALDLFEQYINSLQQEQRDADDLEEAAEKKYPVYWKDYPKDGIARSELSYDTNKQCRDAFIAGAEWQYQKDRGEFAKIKAKTWCEGFDAHKEQMLKDAVEGRVFMSFAPGHNQMVMADVDLPTNTKVRIVILKEEEE